MNARRTFKFRLVPDALDSRNRSSKEGLPPAIPAGSGVVFGDFPELAISPTLSFLKTFSILFLDYVTVVTFNAIADHGNPYVMRLPITAINMKRNDDDRLLTATELAAILSCSPSAVYGLARGGQIPCLRIGGMIRFRRSDVNAILAEDRSEDKNLGHQTEDQNQ